MEGEKLSEEPNDKVVDKEKLKAEFIAQLRADEASGDLINFEYVRSYREAVIRPEVAEFFEDSE